MASVPRTGYLPTLDGWRAIAIFAVLLDHAVAYSSLGQVPWLYRLSRTGPNGVSLFFAISGFLICSRLLEEQATFGRISLRGFYIRRACRILPPAMFYLAAIGVLSFCGVIVVTGAEWWSCVFFSRNYLPASWIGQGWGGYTVHYWSLAVEEHFYLLWPAALVLLGKLRARWFALGLAIAVAGWRMWEFHRHWFDRLIPGLLLGSRTDIRLDGLLLGCLAALLLEDDWIRAAFTRYFKIWPWLVCVAAYIASQLLQHRRSYSLLESVLLTLVVVGTVYHSQDWRGRVLESSAFKWVGRLSYSLYLWQQLFSVFGQDLKTPAIVQVPLSMGMTFAMAWISYKVIERPLIRLGHRLAPPPSEGRDDLQRSGGELVVAVSHEKRAAAEAGN